MPNQKIEDLQKMAEEIENEMEMCERDLKRVGTLNIKAQSFSNVVSRLDSNTKEADALKIKAKSFQGKIKTLSDRRTKEKQEIEQEMVDSKIKYKNITEAKDNTSKLGENEFFLAQSSKLDEFISSSMDSLESLRRQHKYIDKINDKLRDGFVRLGFGSDLLHKIESRCVGDKSLFLILIGALVFIVIFLRFVV